jgi:hypothetical protein
LAFIALTAGRVDIAIALAPSSSSIAIAVATGVFVGCRHRC